MKKLKNSLELPNPTRNTRKFANTLMTDTSGEMNLQSKQDICHVAKVKPTTLAHYVANVIPNLAYIIFPSNPTLPNIYLRVSCLQAVLVVSLMTVDTQSTDQSVAQQLTTTTYDLFTPCSRLHHKP